MEKEISLARKRIWLVTMDNLEINGPEDIPWFEEAKKSLLLDLISEFMFLWIKADKHGKSTGQKVDQKPFVDGIMKMKAAATAYGITPHEVSKAILEGAKQYDQYVSGENNG